MSLRMRPGIFIGCLALGMVVLAATMNQGSPMELDENAVKSAEQKELTHISK